jgi:hypothetical protein
MPRSPAPKKYAAMEKLRSWREARGLNVAASVERRELGGYGRGGYRGWRRCLPPVAARPGNQSARRDEKSHTEAWNRESLKAHAGLSQPQGIALDAYGNVYIADWGNNRLRMVDSGGIITWNHNYDCDRGSRAESLPVEREEISGCAAGADFSSWV